MLPLSPNTVFKFFPFVHAVLLEFLWCMRSRANMVMCIKLQVCFLAALRSRLIYSSCKMAGGTQYATSLNALNKHELENEYLWVSDELLWRLKCFIILPGRRF